MRSPKKNKMSIRVKRAWIKEGRLEPLRKWASKFTEFSKWFENKIPQKKIKSPVIAKTKAESKPSRRK